MNALLRLEAMTVLRAKGLVASFAVSAALVLFFLAWGSRESAVVAFTGFDRVLLGVCLAALFVMPVLALSMTAQALPQARQQGVLEFYASHPVSRDASFWGVFLPRLVASTGPVLLAVLGVGLVALVSGHPLTLGGLAWVSAVLVGQGFCFSAMGMAIGVRARAPETALLWVVILWLVSTLFLDFAMIGALLRWNLAPHVVFALAGLNPVQAGRLGLLSMGDVDLGLLGPVGTWIATTLGPAGTAAYALGWPVVLGALLLLWARHRFLRQDLL